MLKGCVELLVLLAKKAITDEKDPLVFKVLLEIKANEASMDSVVSEEKR